MATTMDTAAPRAAARSGFIQGFGWGLRALVAKELRSRSRGWRSVAMLTGYLLALAAGVAGFLMLAERSLLGTSPWLGMQFLAALAFAAVLLLAFIPVSFTAGAISGERERRTLDLMLVTRAAAAGIAAGKLAGSVLYVLFLLIASLPAFALVYLFGGVPARHIVLVLAVAAATAVAHASLGLVLSALLRRTIVASVAAYLIVLGLLFGLPFAATLAGTDNGQLEEAGVIGRVMGRSSGWMAYGGSADAMALANGPPPAFAYASPLVALASVVPTASDGSAAIVASNFGGPFASGTFLLDLAFGLFAGGAQPIGPPGESPFRAQYVRQDPETGEADVKEALASWVYYVAGSLLMAPVAVLITAVVLAPRRWRFGGRTSDPPPSSAP